jgi:SNF2 family DNA or RNA helicase
MSSEAIHEPLPPQEEAQLLGEAGLLAPAPLAVDAPAIITIAAPDLALPTGSVAFQTPTLVWPAPRVVSLPIGRGPTIKTRGFVFPRSATLKDFGQSQRGSGRVPPEKNQSSADEGRSSGSPTSEGVSRPAARIKPPRDVIKLEDRLFYLLQPPLAAWLSRESLDFPFKPFPYQFDGVAFLYPRHAAVLADEMGLGKTMQAITAIRLLLHGGEVGSVLLVCPKPLVTNWQREFELWAPEVPVMVIEGDQAKRRWQWSLDCAVKIANYELLVRDRELALSRSPACALSRSPDLDSRSTEGLLAAPPQVDDPGDLRSVDSAGAGDPRRAREPRRAPPRPSHPCSERATPATAPQFDLVVLDESQRIKNRGSTTSQIARGIPRRRSWALTGTPVENSADDLLGIFEFVAPGCLRPEMKLSAIGRAVGDYVLRRTKDMVLADMPPKMLRDVEIDLTAEQRESYRLAEEEGVLRLTEMGESATIQHVFELVLRLKQICNFDPATGESAKLEHLAADLEEIAASGRKALVFSQWVDTLSRLAKLLPAFRPLEYHGQIPSRQRDGVIQQFREDARRPLLLISYGAGGVGLNLQFAQYVFLFDRWWNPAVEDQAINRAHRIGVAGPVTVSRLISAGTIEQRIDDILREKREIFDTIFSGAAGPGRRELGLTQAEIFGLFKLKCPSGPLRGAA